MKKIKVKLTTRAGPKPCEPLPVPSALTLHRRRRHHWNLTSHFPNADQALLLDCHAELSRPDTCQDS